jgi:glycine cleavage system H protein
MTVLLMLCMIVTFLAADKILRTVRAARERRPAFATDPGFFGPPEGIRLALNHTWMKTEKGVAVIGADEFLARMLGAVESVILPGVGAAVGSRGPDIAFAHGGRTLHLASPVAGRIIEVNGGVLRNPSIARHDPYGSGWLLKIAPDPVRGTAAGSFAGTAAREWLRDQMALAREFLTGAVPRASLASLPDGGELSEGALLACDADAWKEFERRFTSTITPKPATT